MVTYFKLGFSEHADYESIILISLEGATKQEFVDMYNEAIQTPHKDHEDLAEIMVKEFGLVILKETLEIRCPDEVYQPIHDGDRNDDSNVIVLPDTFHRSEDRMKYMKTRWGDTVKIKED